MHRTLSLDYIAVMSGEIVLRLDSGEEKTVKAGEFIVQRGVNHEWINRSSSEVCRMMVVMVGAEKVVTEDGTELGETVFKK
jgi:quercetin dioxygenase-like cupin family protein